MTYVAHYLVSQKLAFHRTRFLVVGSILTEAACDKVPKNYECHFFIIHIFLFLLHDISSSQSTYFTFNFSALIWEPWFITPQLQDSSMFLKKIQMVVDIAMISHVSEVFSYNLTPLFENDIAS